MNVDEILDEMEELVETGTKVPLSGKRMVDEDRIRDLIDEIRGNLPDEIRQAKGIVNDRAQILDDAKREAEAIITKAENRARALVSEQEIVKESQRRAAEIMANAQTQNRELSNSVAAYCENMLRSTEEQLARSANEAKTTRINLRQAAKNMDK